MKDHPMLFSGPMVRALLDGRKTQTRRLLKASAKDHARRMWPCYENGKRTTPMCHPPRISEGPNKSRISPVPISPGDRIWVRETWAVGNIYDGVRPRDINPNKKPNWCGIRYAATDHRIGINDRPSIHMPRWASRLTLHVTDVRVQRLQEINRGDAMAEGCPFANMAAGPNPVDWFSELWESLNAKRAPWDSKPWVVAYTFDVKRENIDAGPEGTGGRA